MLALVSGDSWVLTFAFVAVVAGLAILFGKKGKGSDGPTPSKTMETPKDSSE
jgi:hypothetical protein